MSETIPSDQGWKERVLITQEQANARVEFGRKLESIIEIIEAIGKKEAEISLPSSTLEGDPTSLWCKVASGSYILGFKYSDGTLINSWYKPEEKDDVFIIELTDGEEGFAFDVSPDFLIEPKGPKREILNKYLEDVRFAWQLIRSMELE